MRPGEAGCGPADAVDADGDGDRGRTAVAGSTTAASRSNSGARNPGVLVRDQQPDGDRDDVRRRRLFLVMPTGRNDDL
jgi:hypothetical protein